MRRISNALTELIASPRSRSSSQESPHPSSFPEPALFLHRSCDLLDFVLDCLERRSFVSQRHPQFAEHRFYTVKPAAKHTISLPCNRAIQPRRDFLSKRESLIFCRMRRAQLAFNPGQPILDIREPID